MLLNSKKTSSEILNFFNYNALVGFKYYLAGRANNVLWVKTRYIKSNYKKESKLGYNSYNQGLFSSDFFVTYWGSINVKMVTFTEKYM